MPGSWYPGRFPRMVIGPIQSIPETHGEYDWMRRKRSLCAEMFDWYLGPGVTLYQVAKRLSELGIPTPRGQTTLASLDGREDFTQSYLQGHSPMPIVSGTFRLADASRPCPRSEWANRKRVGRQKNGFRCRCRRSSPRRYLRRCKRS